MTNKEKEMVSSLREKGLSYSEIARRLELSQNTIKSFCQRNQIKPQEESCKAICKFCGNEIVVNLAKRRRIFCNDSCRMAWWKKARQENHKNIGQVYICECCGAKFWIYRKRKYCSHPCYIQMRFGHEQRE